MQRLSEGIRRIMSEYDEDDIGTVRWFGESWKAPICDPRAHVGTPVGMNCSGHDHLHGPLSEKIRESDQGIMVPFLGENRYVAYHLQCWFHELGLHP